jgi:FKBP-type peptidyl-prolyl cis-trans isomerase SlyD
MYIDKHKVVTIEYRMLDTDGNLIDSTDHTEPLSFIQGRQQVLPGLEARVEGHGVGDRLRFTLEPEDAYGVRDDSLIRRIPRDRFLHHGEFRAGMTFTSGRAGHKRLVTLIEVDQDHVTVDANHPLAGRTLQIDLVIVEVREALDKELATGIIQEMADIYARENENARMHGVPVQGPILSGHQ